MTSVTSFTRTPRGPMGPMPPSRTPVTRHLHYSAARSPTRSPKIIKGGTGETYLIIPSYRSYRTCTPSLSFFFFFRRRTLFSRKWRLESYPRFVGIGDDFIAAVSMPPGATRGWISARGRIEEGKREERVKGDKEGRRRCGALVATGAVQLPP